MNKTVKEKRKIKVWVILLIVVGVIGVLSAGGIIASAPGRREVRDLVINDVDFKKLRDGTYVGEYAGIKDHLRDTQVEVKVAGGKISEIDILKGAIDKAGKAAELTGGLSIDDMFNNVVKLQTLKVDVISGATLTSKTHLKALENALEQAETNNQSVN